MLSGSNSVSRLLRWEPCAPYFQFCISYLLIVLMPSVCDDEWKYKNCERANNSSPWLPAIRLPFPLTQSSPFENCHYDIQPLDVIPHILIYVSGLSAASGLLIRYASIDLIIMLSLTPWDYHTIPQIMLVRMFSCLVNRMSTCQLSIWMEARDGKVAPVWSSESHQSAAR